MTGSGDSTGTWTPAAATPPDVADLHRLAAAWTECGESIRDHLPAELEPTAGRIMHAPRGALDDLFAALDTAELEALVRCCTLLEAHGALEVGARSPVVPLFRAWRRRPDAGPAEGLAGWVKSRSDNRFLPWGSLQDRL